MKTDTLKRSMTSGIVALFLLAIITVPSSAQAATTAGLQAQIQNLLAQITLLQKQLNILRGVPPVCSTLYTDIGVGSTGIPVTNLQNFLINHGFVIPAGATGYFGNQTTQAVAQFQASNGIYPTSGTFGPLTRQKINTYCKVTTTPTTPVVTTPPTTTTPSEPEEILSGEASLDRFEVRDGDDTNLEEGDKNKEIMEISFEVNDGDIKLNRIDIGFSPDEANDEKDPWDTYDTVSVWNGTKKIAEIDASREKNWREDHPTDGDYTLRLSGLSYVVKKNHELKLTVKATVQKSVKGTGDGEIWNVFIPDNGIRSFDADNAVVYAGDTADSVTLNIDTEGYRDEIIIRRSDDDPDASTLQLKDNARSGYIEVLAFDIDTDDSTHDIDIRELPIELTVSKGTLEDYMRDIKLVTDGKTYTKETTVNGLTGIVTFEFDRGDFTIDVGDRITVSVEIDFRALDNENEGTTITGAVHASDIEAEGADDLTDSQLQSSAIGETHTLRTKGQNSSDPVMEAKVTSVSGALNDYVTFSGTLTLTPFGQDAYIPTDGTGITYQLTDALGSPLAASGTAVIYSSARESGNYFVIREGESKTLTIDVTYVPGVSNTTARMQILSVNFSDREQPADQTWLALPANKYRTPTKTIVN